MPDMVSYLQVQTTLLASVQALSGRTRSSIQRNIQEILKLHDALLNQLHHTVFNADEKGPSGGVGPLRRRHKHVRWHSLESADGRSGEGRSHRVRDSVGSIDQRLKGGGKFMTAEPSEAAEVACVFKRFVSLARSDLLSCSGLNSSRSLNSLRMRNIVQNTR